MKKRKRASKQRKKRKAQSQMFHTLSNFLIKVAELQRKTKISQCLEVRVLFHQAGCPCKKMSPIFIRTSSLLRFRSKINSLDPTPTWTDSTPCSTIQDSRLQECIQDNSLGVVLEWWVLPHHFQILFNFPLLPRAWCSLPCLSCLLATLRLLNKITLLLVLTSHNETLQNAY